MIHASKKIDKERCRSLGINYSELAIGAIIGTAILYDVKEYKSKTEFEKDRDKHYAGSNKYSSYKYGYLIKNAHRLANPVPYLGQLKFFEVEYPIDD